MIDCLTGFQGPMDLTVAHSLSFSIVELQLHNVAIDVRLGLPSSLVHKFIVAFSSPLPLLKV